MLKRKFFINFGKSPDHSIDYLLGILGDARVTTLQKVENVTKEELHWQYKDGWNSIGALLAHIAAIEHYFRIEFVEGRKLTSEEDNKWLAALDMGEFLPQLITDDAVEVYQSRLAESRELLLRSLENISFEDLTKRREGYDPENGCNLAWVLYHMAEDEVHHRGQISIIRKLYKDIQPHAF